MRILFFARLAGDVGRQAEDTVLPTSVSHVRGLLRWLGEHGDVWRRALTHPGLSVAVNKQFVEPGAILNDGDEIALVSATQADRSLDSHPTPDAGQRRRSLAPARRRGTGVHVGTQGSNLATQGL